jgi:MraZ protein
MNRSADAEMFRFIGQFRHAVDLKGRISVPASFRTRLDPNDAGAFVLQRGMDGTIEVHPLSGFQEFCERDLRRLPRYQQRSRMVRFMRFGFGQEVVLDSQNRILVPRWMLEDAKIRDEAVVLGNGDFFQIWEPARFEEFRKRAAEHYEDDLALLERQGWNEGPGDVESGGSEVS